MNSLEKKYLRLKKLLTKLGSAVIAFSGGLDSGLLTKVAFDCLGKNIIAVTAFSPTYPSSELKFAKKIAKEIGARHIVIHTQEFKDRNFLNNTKHRCYWCKRELFSRLKEISRKFRIKYILDGTNYDDRKDVRPGLAANKEFSVISPLYKCRFTKQDVKKLTAFLAPSLCNKPSGTCLSSRIPFGEKITQKRLKKIEAAERILKNFLGENILLRARDHNDILRIEVENKGWTRLKKSDINKLIIRLKKCGYKYITLDLEGYVPAGLRA
ncbi:MAG: ATP-dependent sacrificial sulfur transferase LarE [Candidatus Omnitrophota bacterium]|nr:ATP-dependent sacrificial sulfur transferase LarE [Candidatus Omnitrophota bacterium]